MRTRLQKLIHSAEIIGQYGFQGWQRRRRWWADVHLRQRGAAERYRSRGVKLSDEDAESVTEAIASFAYKPVISILMPVYNVEERWLRAAINSVVRQTYPYWELCIADDASPSPHVRRVLEYFADLDKRIKVTYREHNGHISLASNSALDQATGDFIGLLDHDDELTVDALFQVVTLLQSDPAPKMVYSDEDVIDEEGQSTPPNFKPAWSRDLFYSVNYVTHFAVYRTELVKELGGFRAGFEGSQDYDLALRVTELIDDDSIGFVPLVLYHWRAIPGSVAFAGSEKPYAHERARLALREHFERTGVNAEVVESQHDLHRVIYRLPETRTSVDLITSGETRVTLSEGAFDLAVCEVREPTAGALNEAARSLGGEIILFVDSGLDFPERDRIEQLLGAGLQPGIGAVAGRIIGTDGIVEQGGLVLGADLSPSFAHHGFPREEPGNLGRNLQTGNFLAVSKSCLAIRRSLFDELCGFDELTFPVHLFDIDLCLRIWESRRRIVVLPNVEFVRRREQNESPKPTQSELSRFQVRWEMYVRQDPFCNPNLKRDGSFDIL